MCCLLFLPVKPHGKFLTDAVEDGTANTWPSEMVELVSVAAIDGWGSPYIFLRSVVAEVEAALIPPFAMLAGGSPDGLIGGVETVRLGKASCVPF